MVMLYVSAWASALLVLTVMGNAKASDCGMSNSTATHAFSYTVNQYVKFLNSCEGRRMID